MVGWHQQLNGHEFEQTPGEFQSKLETVETKGRGRVGVYKRRLDHRGLQQAHSVELSG